MLPECEDIRLSAARRAIAAMLRYSREIPTVPVVRTVNVADLDSARRRTDGGAISWSSIFIKAYGLTCLRFAELRRAWIPWPRARLYQHPGTDCAVAIERQWQGENAVLMGRIWQPEGMPLRQINDILRHYRETDVWSVSPFRASLRLGMLPPLLQRLVLWDRLDRSGKRRAKHIGTFGMSNYGMLGAESVHPIGPQTTVLTLGPVRPGGDVTVKIIYDHRVLDGSTVARSLEYLDEVLHDAVLSELRGGAGARIAA